MTFIADLHIHSKYSRATSPAMSPEGLWKWAQIKGISVLGTGDFTHPLWLSELEEKLSPAGNGLFQLKDKYRPKDVPASCRSEVFFMLSAEISSIYKKNGKTRKVHSLLYVPGFREARKIQQDLAKIGNIHSDGRPILGLDARELLRVLIDVSADAMLVPAHAWTPHFSVFGAVSGFDSMEECFEELTPHISAIETGLSSDPPMNWRLSALDGLTLLSNSDAHSPTKLGREANIFETDISYLSIMGAIRQKTGFRGTIEFFPEEGKYHHDGHRACGVSLHPKESLRHMNLCPACGKRLTMGVLHRVGELADRDEGFRPAKAPSFRSVIPLTEIIAETLKVGAASKRVTAEYMRVLETLGSEFRILLESPLSDLASAGSPALGEAIMKTRSGDVALVPGYDGVYGRIKVFEKDVK